MCGGHRGKYRRRSTQTAKVVNVGPIRSLTWLTNIANPNRALTWRAIARRQLNLKTDHYTADGYCYLVNGGDGCHL
jgi:hypothetical protein